MFVLNFKVTFLAFELKVNLQAFIATRALTFLRPFLKEISNSNLFGNNNEKTAIFTF